VWQKWGLWLRCRGLQPIELRERISGNAVDLYTIRGFMVLCLQTSGGGFDECMNFDVKLITDEGYDEFVCKRHGGSADKVCKNWALLAKLQTDRMSPSSCLQTDLVVRQASYTKVMKKITLAVLKPMCLQTALTTCQMCYNKTMKITTLTPPNGAVCRNSTEKIAHHYDTVRIQSPTIK